tara:strand:+ start:496 stop:1089 length:594 start_codon:yes stop_codon:yes gene_type:complete
VAILSKLARKLASRAKKKGPPKTNAQKIDAMTSKLKKLEGQKTRRKEAAERNKREKEQKLAREKAFAKYQKKKQNTKSIFKKQGPGQAQTQKAVEGQRRYKVGQAKGFATGVGATILTAGAATALYKKDALFASKLQKANKEGKSTIKYKGDMYKVPKNLPALPIPKPKTTPSKFKKGTRISYAERFKEIEQEKKKK